MTTTTIHRPRCTRPGWITEPARAIAGVVIARCADCGAVELRTATAAANDGSAR